MYNKRGQCIIGGPVYIDINGMCSECVYIDISDEELERIKLRQLCQLEDEHFWYESDGEK